MTISDPILNRKLNMLRQEFGLAMSFELNATWMRMRQEDQHVGAFMVFEQDRLKKFFLGYELDGRPMPGFSQTVKSYFEAFPQNLHPSLLHELEDWLAAGTQAALDGVRMRLNQLLSGEDPERHQATYAAMEAGIRFIRETESQRLYTELREILQRREYERQNQPRISAIDNAKAWFKNNPLGIALTLIGIVSGFILNRFEILAKLARFLFR